ncbi:Mur ligase family protein [Hydrogenimonas urashimensis]|uniref:Mur ligase family protein n=1 Tax=Hydrogenimonas urashimensis TaxID=2740515 RepID=UPI001916C785|nr:Mur ligase family protein [Hydrogenimonas urashimensis]
MIVSLFGYGKTTRAIAEKLGPCDFYDDHVTVPHKDDKGNRLLPPSLFDPEKSDVEIPSPGFPPTHPLIREAKNLISEYDLFLSDYGRQIRESRIGISSFSPRPFTIWISGTNGKTTTTQMLTHLLEDRGAVSGGNIGTPLARMDAKAPIWVLETSSFTLHYTRFAKPDLYLLLPVTPDHLSWHGGEEAYTADKLKPLGFMQEGEAVLLPHLFERCATDGFLIPYEGTDDICAYFGIDPKKVEFEGAFALDAVLALGVAKILFDEIDYEKINKFKLEPHRQEKIIDSRGRLWINDTKATNIDATAQALVPWKERTVHLILGGDDKGVDLSPLFEKLKEYDLFIYAIGSNREKIAKLAQRYRIGCEVDETLERAVEAIDKRHTQKSVAILSPAAASLDQFASYAQRGELFKKIVSSF